VKSKTKSQAVPVSQSGGIVNAKHLLGHADIRTTQLYLAETEIHALPLKSFSQTLGSRPTA
jgi:hypothetical protein